MKNIIRLIALVISDLLNLTSFYWYDFVHLKYFLEKYIS